MSYRNDKQQQEEKTRNSQSFYPVPRVVCACSFLGLGGFLEKRVSISGILPVVSRKNLLPSENTLGRNLAARTDGAVRVLVSPSFLLYFSSCNLVIKEMRLALFEHWLCIINESLSPALI